MTKYTEREVRDNETPNYSAHEVRCFLVGFKQRVEAEIAMYGKGCGLEIELKMLTQLADMLAEREKAEPVYQHRLKHGPIRRWFDCSKETYEEMGRNEYDCVNFDRRILYTHPAAQPRVPDGYVMVPKEMRIDSETLAALAFHCGSDDEKPRTDAEAWSGAVLWVGDMEDDYGNQSYGLNIANEEYMEEGSVQLCAFPLCAAQESGR